MTHLKTPITKGLTINRNHGDANLLSQNRSKMKYAMYLNVRMCVKICETAR